MCLIFFLVVGFALFLLYTTIIPFLCLLLTAGEHNYTIGMNGGEGREGDREKKERKGINRTESGNDELREQLLIFHFDRLSSIRRQKRWFMCPERRHLLLVFSCKLLFFFLGIG